MLLRKSRRRRSDAARTPGAQNLKHSSSDPRRAQRDVTTAILRRARGDTIDCSHARAQRSYDGKRKVPLATHPPSEVQGTVMSANRRFIRAPLHPDTRETPSDALAPHYSRCTGSLLTVSGRSHPLFPLRGEDCDGRSPNDLISPALRRWRGQRASTTALRGEFC